MIRPTRPTTAFSETLSRSIASCILSSRTLSSKCSPGSWRSSKSSSVSILPLPLPFFPADPRPPSGASSVCFDGFVFFVRTKVSDGGDEWAEEAERVDATMRAGTGAGALRKRAAGLKAVRAILYAILRASVEPFEREGSFSEK